MRILLVHNDGAGDGRFDRETVMRLIGEAGHQTKYVDLANRSWRDALTGSIDAVAAAGGDGTVAKVGRAVAGRGIPIAVLPLGTANNIAGALGTSMRSVPELIAGWASARRQPFDVGVAQPGKPLRFLESAGLGLLATTIARIAHGDAGYVDELSEAEDRLEAAIDVVREELAAIRPVPVELELDGQTVSGEFLLLEVLNFGGAGANLRLAHDADPADGLFDVVMVGEDRRQELLEHLPLYRIDPARAPRLPSRTARRVRVSCAACQLHLDDRLRRSDGGALAIDLSIEPRALTFLV